MTQPDLRPAELALRPGRGELTASPRRRSAAERAEALALIVERLDTLPPGAAHDPFGPGAQRILYVHFEDGASRVALILDPPTALRAPSATALEAHVRAHVAEARGVSDVDVHVFGKSVPRELAWQVLRSLA